MAAVVPWSALEAVIEPYYPKAGKRGGQPKPLGAMLRIYFMQNWFGLSDPGMEDALYEIESMRRVAGLELIEDALPDETTILNFRHLLEAHQLTAQLMNTINDVLTVRGLLLKGGTMVDATIIHAPSSTNNTDKTRDPEMHQTRKGKQWYFGMKAHVGADAGYQGADQREEVATKAPNATWHIAMRPGKRKRLPTGSRFSALTLQLEQLKARVRAKVELSFPRNFVFQG